ncbi:tetratricopeptide repeat protein [Nitriliruptoraceae bacterium ZYF776]|nr:tetratricopeptide repeat protein [Profundirhabdus halotolerans]
MSGSTRDRLLRLVRRNDADLAEAALLVAAEASPSLDVAAGLLRLDALADQLTTTGFRATGDAAADGRELAARLHAAGFRGHAPGERVPEDALLDRVLDRRVGLPITLSIVYVALARRLDVPAFPIALPGHVVVGVGERPAVLDPFHGGLELDEGAVADRVRQMTDGRLAFRRAMLRPAPAVNVVRRLLNNLTRDYTDRDRLREALWTVEVKQLLPNRLPDDHRVRGRLLDQLGRFDEAAAAFEDYLDAVGPDAPDRDEVQRAAIRSRARLN